ncbi:MAG: hypothetical protein EWM47_01125 [Anaerolineaceae bacterium]|nr:MAG: hypothetical protein EWM47_01125 [Anaerolineaceae bacterium]
MSKKTRLGEDAAIYQKHEKQSEKEKLRDMPWKKKMSYLWEYYRLHALLFIAAAAFISYSIYTFTKPKIATRLHAVIINNTVEPQIWDDYSEKITDYLELDTLAEDVRLNYSFYYNGAADYEANMRQAFGVYLAASEIDVVIAPMSEFSLYVKNGFFTPLSDQLPTDLYSSLTDKFYLTDTEDNPKVAAYGIYMKDTKIYRDHSISTEDDPVLIGIIANSTNKENSVDFIRYLFNEK